VTVKRQWRKAACPDCGHRFRPDATDTLAHATARPKDAPAAPPHGNEDSLVGHTLGRWRLERLIGRGGMGRVYEGQETNGTKRVALKVLREDLAQDPAFARRFRREARLLGSLSHPHVVEVLEQGETHGRLWFAMPYVRGENLRRRMERGRVLPAEAARIAAQVASALSYAHERGVIHRDLKPENVLLDEEGRVHLVDFGLSRLVSEHAPEASTRLTRTDVVLGTYEYMSPEQRRGSREVDGRADVYALGVLFYEMLTGSLPLGRFQLPSELVPDAPEAFDEVVTRALAPKVEDRTPSAAALHDAIERAAQGRPGNGSSSKTRAIAAEVLPRRPAHEIEEARGLLRHVELLGVFDRVGAVALIAIAFNWLHFSEMLVPSWVGNVSTLLLVVLGFLLWSQGRALSRMREGSREAQITASVLMLFLPPFFTALGLYGLFIMTSDRARRAFAMGRRELLGLEPVGAPTPVASTPLPLPAPFLLRLFSLLSILWALYAGFVALDLIADTSAGSSMLDDARTMLVVSGLGAAFALFLCVSFAIGRRRRRGLGLASWSLLALLLASGALGSAIAKHEVRSALEGFFGRPASIERVRLSGFPPSPPLPWENHR
jgi:tRNA A-37 threonylcarbamoyl transferase component Bud32